MTVNLELAKTWLKDILKFDSFQKPAEGNAPFGKSIDDCLNFSLSLMKDLGFEVKNGNGYYGYGEIGSGELFGILSHVDVVPEGGGWTKNPYGGEEIDGRIYGRGALDDKGPYIACLYAAARLLSEGLTLKKRLRFIVGCNEESGWECMDKYIANEELPVLSFSPDGDFPVINCEKGLVHLRFSIPLPKGLTKFEGGVRANMVPDLAKATLANGTVVEEKGVACHASRPKNGENALVKLLAKLKNYPELKKLYSVFKSSDGKGAKLKLHDKKSGKLTMNLGTAATENGEIVFTVDIRHPYAYVKEQIAAILEKAVGRKVSVVHFHNSLYVDENHALVTTLLSAYKRVTGDIKAKPLKVGGATYARVMPLCVAFGPMFPNSNAQIHCADENVKIEDFIKMSEIYYEAIKAICF